MAATCDCKPRGYHGWIYHTCEERNRGLPANRRVVDIPGKDSFEVYFCPETQLFGGTDYGPHYSSDPTCGCKTPRYVDITDSETFTVQDIDSTVSRVRDLYVRPRDKDRRAVAERREKKLARKYRGK